MIVMLGLLVVICGFGWLNRWVCCAALIKHMDDVGALPTEKEMKACVTYVWKQLLHVN